jgi:hypothetical protein
MNRLEMDIGKTAKTTLQSSSLNILGAKAE